MGIDEMKSNFLTGLSVTEASKWYNVLGDSSLCPCLTDCSKRAWCSCRKLGIFVAQGAMGDEEKISSTALCATLKNSSNLINYSVQSTNQNQLYNLSTNLKSRTTNLKH